jgi:hypothetical protein
VSTFDEVQRLQRKVDDLKYRNQLLREKVAHATAMTDLGWTCPRHGALEDQSAPQGPPPDPKPGRP